MSHNPVAKHAHKYNRGAVHTDRKKQHRLDPDDPETAHEHYDPYLHLKHELAQQYNCSIHDIVIEDHSIINETCVYIKGTWAGYVQPDGSVP